MFCVRVVSNNNPDEEVDGINVLRIDSMHLASGTSGDLFVKYTDCALDPGTLFIPFGKMLQVYH